MTSKARVRAILLTLLGLLVARPVLATALQALLPDASVTPESSYMASILSSVLMFALPGLLLTPPRRLEVDAAPAPERLNPAAVLGLAVLARLVVIPLNEWWTALTGAAVTPIPMPESGAGVVLLIAAVTVVPAVAEELFFRDALLTNLLRNGSRLQAVTLTTLMFALMHGSLAGLPGHLIISLLLTLTMMNSGRLLEPILLHLLYNLLALFRMEMASFVPWVAGAGLAGALALMIVRMPRGERRRLPAAEWLLCGAVLLGMGLQYLN